MAAGFGYQIGTVSTIAVKVYDAESGNILSDEVYELAVKESDGVSIESRAAYFCWWSRTWRDRSLLISYCGYTMQTPECSNGKGDSIWCSPTGRQKGKLVSAMLPRRAIVTKMQIAEATMEQPVFLLRAIDAATGMLVWEDEFTTVRMRIPRAH